MLAVLTLVHWIFVHNNLRPALVHFVPLALLESYRIWKTHLAGRILPSTTGLYECGSGDRAGWQSPEELERQMIAEGWTVRRIKEDGGCYEAYGTTPEGGSRPTSIR